VTATQVIYSSSSVAERIPVVGSFLVAEKIYSVEKHFVI
jgi:hypothetical protein